MSIQEEAQGKQPQEAQGRSILRVDDEQDERSGDRVTTYGGLTIQQICQNQGQSVLSTSSASCYRRI